MGDLALIAGSETALYMLRSHDDGKSWADLLKGWLQLVPATGRFHSVEGEVVTLQDMNAGEYVDSDPLDLDHLSTGPS